VSVEDNTSTVYIPLRHLSVLSPGVVYGNAHCMLDIIWFLSRHKDVSCQWLCHRLV